MVVSCVVVGCTSRFVDNSLSFHRIPREEKRRQLWLNAIKRKNWAPTNNSRVCGRHFISGKASNDVCSPDYAPSLHMGYRAIDASTVEGTKGKFGRLKKRGRRKEPDAGEDEQKAEAAAILLNLSMLAQMSGADVKREHDADASRPDTDKYDGCISRMAKLRSEDQQTMRELARLQHEKEALTNKCEEKQFKEQFRKAAMVKRGHRGHQHGLRIRFDASVELSMECSDEPLSTSQVESYDREKVEYDKAMKLVADAKAGKLPAQLQAAADAEAAAKAAVEAEKWIQQQQHQQQQLQQQALAAVNTSTEPEVVILGENNTPMMAVSSINPVPQQVYKFVNLQGQPLASQWVIRPLMPVMPQQNTQNTPKPAVMQDMSKPGALDNSGIKRTSMILGDANGEYVSPTKKKKDKKNDQENSGTLVPLDEYYYGKKEGDPTYREDKGEYRFKCWYCSKMLYNNVRTMTHMQGHIDSEKQQNLDLTDLTQCRHCYKQFDTPFEMQTHIEKVHMNNANVLMCRICEKDHDSRGALTSHMRQFHNACEMPYICHICHFRSSMYSDVVDHFKKKHDSSESLLCLYCLRVFHVKFVAQGWGMTQSYYHHLLRHQSKTNAKKCSLCKLTFFNSGDVKAHRKKDHAPNQKGVIGMNAKYMTPDQVMIRVPEAGLEPKNNSGVKSLNAPAVSKIKEHRGLIFPESVNDMYCYECKMLMVTQDHYKKYIQCSMCRFATSCSFAYANHMMGFHSGQMTNLALNIPRERPVQMGTMYCLCGFGSKYGNKIANHLVGCSKRSCYKQKPEVVRREEREDEMSDPRKKPGASLLDVLGLVKKPNLASSNAGSSRDDCDDGEPYEPKYESPPNSPPTLSPISQDPWVSDGRDSNPPELTGPKRWDTVKLKDSNTPTKKSVFLGALDSQNEPMEVEELSNSDQETERARGIEETAEKGPSKETEPSTETATEDKNLEESAATEDKNLEESATTEDKNLETSAATEDTNLEESTATEDKNLEESATTEDKNLEKSAATEDKNLEESATTDKNLEESATTEDKNLEKSAATEDKNLEESATTEDKNLEKSAATEDKNLEESATTDKNLEESAATEDKNLEESATTEDKNLEESATTDKNLEESESTEDKNLEESASSKDASIEPSKLDDETTEIHDAKEIEAVSGDLATEGGASSKDPTAESEAADENSKKDSKKAEDTATEGEGQLKDTATEDSKVSTEIATEDNDGTSDNISTEGVAKSKDVTQSDEASETVASESNETAKDAATEDDISKDASMEDEATAKDIVTEGSEVSNSPSCEKERENISTESINQEILVSKNPQDDKNEDESDDGMKEISVDKNDIDNEQITEDVEMESSADLKKKNVEDIEKSPIDAETKIEDSEQNVPDIGQSRFLDQGSDEFAVNKQNNEDTKTDSELETDIVVKIIDEEHVRETKFSAETSEETNEFKTDHSRDDSDECNLVSVNDSSDNLNSCGTIPDKNYTDKGLTDAKTEAESENESTGECVNEIVQNLPEESEKEKEMDYESDRINECSDNKNSQPLIDDANMEKMHSDEGMHQIEPDEGMEKEQPDESMHRIEPDKTMETTQADVSMHQVEPDENNEKAQPDESMRKMEPDESMEKTKPDESMHETEPDKRTQPEEGTEVEEAKKERNPEESLEKSKTDERKFESEARTKSVLPGPSKSSERSHGQGDERSQGQGDERSHGQGDERSHGQGDERSQGQGDERCQGERSQGQGDERSQGQGDERSQGQGDDRSKSHTDNRVLHKDKSSRDRDDYSVERDRKRDRDTERYDHHRSDRDWDRDHRHNRDRRDNRDNRDNRDRSWGRHQDYQGGGRRDDRGYNPNYHSGNKDYQRDHHGQNRDRHGYGGYQGNRDYRGSRGRGYQGGGYRGGYY